jgi:hypothetical protein
MPQTLPRGFDLPTTLFTSLSSSLIDEIVAGIERLGLPQLHETADLPPNLRLCSVRFFDLEAGWNWYGVEFDRIPRLFFGCTKTYQHKWGYFRLDDLVNMSTRQAPIVIDWSFTPTMAAYL